MSLATGQPIPAVSLSTTGKLTGEVVYLFAFDIAYEISRRPIQELLGQPVAQFVPDASKKSPRQLFFYRPQMVRLPPIERFGPRGPIRMERTVKMLPVGAISIMVRVPFCVDRIEDLVCYHDLRFPDGAFLYDEVRDLAEQVRMELGPCLVRPARTLGDEEAYTVFCFHAPLRDPSGQPLSAEDWLMANRRAVASLLTEEPDPRQLSDQEADESSAKYFSYYENDVVVIDWDAALVVDEPRYFDEVLYIMELANLQLAELEAYDRILDDAVETSYRDLAQRRWTPLRLNRTQRELREIRIDLARLQDELSNITKFFGDWHLARIYQGLAVRFHLQEWHNTIDQKLRTLDELYQILRQDQTNLWMIILEASIVALFVLDIIKSFL
ncbi:MAG: hypothetical protein RMJ35_09745 [Phycisphaerales bacterium]|nr:hypothetical protein [Phycisphaerales bacterium]